MIGYRIPTEDKHSMSIMKVVGFLEDVHGATIIVPDEFVTRSGSDFDIDTVYLMAYSNEIVDGKVQKIQFLDDSNSTIQERFDLKYRPKHAEISALIKTKLSNDLNRLAELSEEKKRFMLDWLSRSIPDSNIVEDEDKDTAIAMLLSRRTLSEKIKYFDDILNAENKRVEDLGITVEDFANHSPAEQNTSRANANRLIDVFKTILSAEFHSIEFATPNYFDDITEAGDNLNRIANINDKDANPLLLETQSNYRERSMAAVTLKGMAVNTLNLAGMLQFLNVNVAESYSIEISKAGVTGQLARGISKEKYGETKEGQADILRLNQIGRHNNDFFNDQRVPITTYVSQVVSNTFDAVADPLPPNVNPNTLVAWMVIPMMGGTWAFSTYLLNTTLFKEYSKIKASGFSETSSTADYIAMREAKGIFLSKFNDNLELAHYNIFGTTVSSQEYLDKKREIQDGSYTISEEDILWYLEGKLQNEDDLYRYIAVHNEIVNLADKVMRIGAALNTATFALAVDRKSIGPNLFNIQKVEDAISRLYRHSDDNKLPESYKKHSPYGYDGS